MSHYLCIKLKHHLRTIVNIFLGICRAWNGGILTSVLTCIKSNCDSSLEPNLLLSPLELTCDLAGVPISSSVISSALQAATTTAIVTSYTTATDTVTQSYYWQSTFGTIATTVVVPITESNGDTVIVAFPVTIEPSTTIYGSPSTSTPATASPSSSSDCSNPGIIYGYGLDGLTQPGFEPANQTQFPHGASPDIATIESFICNRLVSPCHAAASVNQACSEAFDSYSGLTGQNAADVWNIAMGLSVTSLASTITFTSTAWVGGWSSTTSTESVWESTSWTASWTSTTTTTTATATNAGDGLGDPPTSTATTFVTGGAAAATTDGGGSPFDAQGAAMAVRPGGVCVVLVLGLLLCVTFL